MVKKILFIMVCSCFSYSGFAMEFERPIIKERTLEHQISLWAQYDRFDPQMDFIGYTNSFDPKAARINSIINQRFGLIYAPADYLQLAYTFNRQQDDVTRFTEPKNINTNSSGHHLRAQYSFYKTERITLAVEAGLRQHQAEKEDFYKYDFPGGQVTWPGHVLVSLEGDDQASLLALRGKYDWNSLRIHLGIEQRYVKVSALMYSQSKLVTSLLASQAPQKEPWNEKHTISQFSLDYDITQSWAVAVDLQHYDITRTNYIPRKNKVDYNSNDTMDLYLSWQLTDYLKPYVHGHLSRRFTLGSVPFSYTTRSNHKFKNKYGYASAGLEYKF